MKLLIYYSYNHNCFKSKFGFLTYNLKFGYLNGFNEEFIGYVDLSYPENLLFKIKYLFDRISIFFRRHFGRKKKIIIVEKHRRWYY